MDDLYRILIAEDDLTLSSVLMRLIWRLYPDTLIEAFENGRDALVAYDQTGADLLLVNHRMPFMDGPTLIRIVRSRGDGVPIIGMSGNPLVRDAYLAAGATAFAADVDLITELPSLLHRYLPPALQARAHT